MDRPIDKRAAVLGLLSQAGTRAYTPAAFFMHFPKEFHSGEAALRKHEEYFRFTGMDLVKIQFEMPWPTFEPAGPSDWKQLPRLGLDFFEPQLEVVRGLVNRLRGEAVVVLTLYSPFMVAGNIGGRENLRRHLEEDPEAAIEGVRIAAESLIPLVRDCAEAGLDGFYHSTQGGESGRFSRPEIFEKYVKPTDLMLLREIPSSCAFNILHICDYHREEFGTYDDLSVFLDYPGQAVSCWHGTLGSKTISEMFGRPYLGGMERKGPLWTGPVEAVRTEAKASLDSGPERMILGADCTIPSDAPWENLRAAVEEAHFFGHSQSP